VVARAAGQVVASELVLGKQVEAGDLLVQLDDRAERLALAEGRSRLADLDARLTALASMLEAEHRAVADHAAAAVVALDEQQARIEEARAVAKLAEQRFERTRGLVEKAVASRVQLDRARAERDAKRAVVKSLEVAHSHRAQQQRVETSDREVRIAALERERAELAGERATQQASLARLQQEVALRQVRAPVAGRVGQISEVVVGAAVTAGEKLAYVVPEGRPRAVAHFPVSAGGRIRAGQTARLRLDGFSWLEYGSLHATVKDVANETQGELLRVEFDLHADPGLRIPVEHGLPGSAEVEIERVAPATLVLRRIGALLRA
jgi:membrane fusion protein (multidrug efflux system)